MSKRSKRNRRDKLAVPRAAKRRFPGAAVVFLTIAVAVSLGFLWWKVKFADVSSAQNSSVEAIAANRAATKSNTEFQQLKGRWQRPDGGYIVEIKSIAEDGAMDAAYFNPKSIHVSKAEASRDGDATKVFIELRDVNYPGSTYTLNYDPGSDQLKGVYYQAVEKQRFPVAFVRLK
jgi:uncharacterized protein (DUF2147 family)